MLLRLPGQAVTRPELEEVRKIAVAARGVYDTIQPLPLSRKGTVP